MNSASSNVPRITLFHVTGLAGAILGGLLGRPISANITPASFLGELVGIAIGGILGFPLGFVSPLFALYLWYRPAMHRNKKHRQTPDDPAKPG